MLSAELDAGESIQTVEKEPCLEVAGDVPEQMSLYGHYDYGVVNLQSTYVDGIGPIGIGDPSQGKIIQAVVSMIS